MKAKALSMGSVLAAMLLVLAGVSWAGGRIDHSQKRQHKRITAGVRSRAITDKEFTRLNREQSRIRQAVEKARADGRFNYRERHRVHRLQDKASKHIYRAKHNRVAYYNCCPSFKHRQQHCRRKPMYYDCHASHQYGPTCYNCYFRGKCLEPHYTFAFSIGWW